MEKFHVIWMLGNKTAHGRSIHSDDALALLRDAICSVSGCSKYIVAQHMKVIHPI